MIHSMACAQNWMHLLVRFFAAAVVVVVVVVVIPYVRIA